MDDQTEKKQFAYTQQCLKNPKLLRGAAREVSVTLDLNEWFQDVGDLPERTPNAVIGALKGSDILRIAAEIRAYKAAGNPVAARRGVLT